MTMIDSELPMTIPAMVADSAARYESHPAVVTGREIVTYRQLDDLVRRCYGSADFREGVAAFLEKRPARFTGA